MRRARAPLIVVACAAALGLAWLTSRGSVRELAPLDAVTAGSSEAPTSGGPASSVLPEPQELRAGSDADDGNRVDVVAEERATRRRKPHPNPPWATIGARLVLAGEPGPHVAVPLRYEHLGRSWKLGTTPALGELETKLSRPGQYRFYVNAKALPEAYSLANPRGDGPLSAFSPRTERVELAAGQRFEAELYVFEERRFTGQVVNAAGVPVEGARLLLDELVGDERERVGARTTDRYGRFEFLRLLPTRYEVRLQGPRESSGASLGIPLPIACDLIERSLEHQRVAFGDGGVNVRGRVVDQDGQPFAGLYVDARYLETQVVAERHSRTGELAPSIPAADEVEAPRTRQASVSGGSRVVTDAEGEFVFLGLQPRTVRLELGSEGQTTGPHTKPVASVKHVTIDLSDAEEGELDLGTNTLERRDDFEVSGHVVLIADRHEGKRLRLRRVQVSAWHGPEGQPELQLELDDDQVHFDRETGAFTVHGHPGIEVLELRVSVWPAKDHVKTYAFPVSPRSVQRDVELEYP